MKQVILKLFEFQSIILKISNGSYRNKIFAVHGLLKIHFSCILF